MSFKNSIICLKIVLFAIVFAAMWFCVSFIATDAAGQLEIWMLYLIILVGTLIPAYLIEYIVNHKTPSYTENKYVKFSHRMLARRFAHLELANSFLNSYSDIGKNLRFSNKYCSVELWANGTTITGRDKTNPAQVFKITRYIPTEESDLICIFCENFNHETTFDDLLNCCKECGVKVEFSEQTPNQNNPVDIQEQSNKKIDINNCSEFELTELPMINIVMAKKAVKKRDEIGGFKTIDDFFLFLKLKPHAEKQLRDRICVNKMKNLNKKIARNSERNVDL